MSDEPLFAILAEFRAFALRAADEDKMISPESVLLLADRVEAAYKREHAEWHAETDAAKEERNRIACKMRYEFAAKCRACKAAPGNSAALREAIVNVASFAANAIDYDGPERDVDAYRWLGRIAQTASAALAAPVRNCDRFQSSEEALDEFNKTHESLKFCYGELHKWLFAPAEGEAK